MGKMEQKKEVMTKMWVLEEGKVDKAKESNNEEGKEEYIFISYLLFLHARNA
jgi:hypothetical protein